MQICDECDTIWTGIATPNEPFEVFTTEESMLTITNLCVYPTEETPKTGRVLLYVRVNDGEEVCVAPFTLGSFESMPIEISLMYGEKAVFTIKGAKANVHLAGYISGALTLETKGAGKPLVENPPEAEEEDKK